MNDAIQILMCESNPFIVFSGPINTAMSKRRVFSFLCGGAFGFFGASANIPRVPAIKGGNSHVFLIMGGKGGS
jgi:hypothetical protein